MATLFTAEGYLDVYAQFDADLYCGLSGGGILQVGSRMASSIPDANVVRIGDGVMVTSEGRAIIITAGSYDDFDIPVGAAGITAYYVIGYRLYSDQDNVRVAEQFVYTASSATDLPASSGTLREGATEVYVPVYRVRQEGLTITSVTALVDTLYPLSYFKTVIESLSSQNASLTALINNHFVQPGTSAAHKAAGTCRQKGAGRRNVCQSTAGEQIPLGDGSGPERRGSGRGDSIQSRLWRQHRMEPQDRPVRCPE